MRQRQILDVKKVYALAEDLRLMVLLDPEALSRVTPPETLLKDCQNFLVHHSFFVRAMRKGRGDQRASIRQAFLWLERCPCPGIVLHKRVRPLNIFGSGSGMR